MFVLGIDPGVSRCGYGCVESGGAVGRAVAVGVLTTPPSDPLPERLAALAGRGRALHILLSGRVMMADEALRAGLVEEVVESAGFDDRIDELARGIAAAPPAAVAGIKRSVDAVRPHRNPELAAEAIATFTKTWTAPAHWRAVEQMERKRTGRT